MKLFLRLSLIFEIISINLITSISEVVAIVAMIKMYRRVTEEEIEKEGSSNSGHEVGNDDLDNSMDVVRETLLNC